MFQIFYFSKRLAIIYAQNYNVKDIKKLKIMQNDGKNLKNKKVTKL